MSAEQPKGGGRPESPKRVHGRRWMEKRHRPAKGRSWTDRKMHSPRYCPPTKTRG